MKLIRNALADGKTSFQTQYLLGTMKTPGDKESGVKFVSEDMIPNSGIVRIAPDQTAKKGDIIIGEWGASMFRGIVVDAKDPKAPKAIFIGLSHDNPAKADDGKTGIGQFAFQLKAGEWNHIENAYDPGTSCALKVDKGYKLVQVFRASGDKLIGTQFTEFKAVPKADCIALPVKPTYKVGTVVWAPWVGTMTKGKITKVDTGRYNIKWESGGSDEMIAFGDVIDEAGLPPL